VPVEEPSLQRRLIRILDAFFKDNTQSSLIQPDGTSVRLPRAKGIKAVRAQEHFYTEAKRAAKAREHERAMTFEPHVPSA
jgi:polyphosphate kinase